ncbi:hypothetical protein K438DRAFT_1988294 [Mycena galopus ATCC 62051]|nr:hypothetical protein K438DRAFT_1988294 [Mycena galopus ATCC 62051]
MLINLPYKKMRMKKNNRRPVGTWLYFEQPHLSLHCVPASCAVLFPFVGRLHTHFAYHTSLLTTSLTALIAVFWSSLLADSRAVSAFLVRCPLPPSLSPLFTTSLTTLVAEQLVHLSFRALGGVQVRYPCPGCGIGHHEFYSLEKIGNLDTVVRTLRFWIVAIGGTFEQ